MWYAKEIKTTVILLSSFDLFIDFYFSEEERKKIDSIFLFKSL